MSFLSGLVTGLIVGFIGSKVANKSGQGLLLETRPRVVSASI